MPPVALAAGAFESDAVVAIVVAVLAVVIARWVRTWRRPASAPPPTVAPSTGPAAGPARPAIPIVRGRRPTTTSAGLAVATTGMVCPTCRTEYAGMMYCQRDARRLVAAEEMLEGRSPGGMCARCRRAYEPGLRKCPHDGGELVSVSAYRATRRPDPGATGVLAKVCPVCRHRYDLSSRFCGRDGHDLVVVN